MLFKSIDQIPAFIAGDETLLKEVLHPHNDAVDLPYSLAHAEIPSGKASLPHILQNEELYLFQKGEGRIVVANDAREVKAGDLVLVPAGKRQYVQNTGAEALVFLCIVSPPWSAAQEEIG